MRPRRRPQPRTGHAIFCAAIRARRGSRLITRWEIWNLNGGSLRPMSIWQTIRAPNLEVLLDACPQSLQKLRYHRAVTRPPRASSFLKRDVDDVRTPNVHICCKVIPAYLAVYDSKIISVGVRPVACATSRRNSSRKGRTLGRSRGPCGIGSICSFDSDRSTVEDD
jgi:hypothetical protein